MRRRDFLAAGAVGLPLAGLTVAKALDLEEEPAARTRARPLRVPADGKVRVAFAIGPHVNVIDIAGPWEVFQDVGVEAGGRNPFRLFTVAETSDAGVRGPAGLTVVPHHTYGDAPQPERRRRAGAPCDRRDAGVAARGGERADLVMSVCTGAFILAEAGLLDGLTATTHHGSHADFARTFPKVKLVRGRALRRARPRRDRGRADVRDRPRAARRRALPRARRRAGDRPLHGARDYAPGQRVRRAESGARQRSLRVGALPRRIASVVTLVM